MPTPINLSHSDINLFLRCRRSFLWSYTMNYNAPDKLTGPLALGTRVHAALERMYLGEDAIEAHDALAYADVETLESGFGPAWELDEIYKDIVVGRNCVAAYQDWQAETGADQGLTVLGVEQQIEAPILDGRVLLRAKLDLLMQRDDGGIIGIDFKTTGRDLGRTQADLGRSYQLQLYDLVLRLSRPDSWISAAEYRVIRKVAKRSRGVPQIAQFGVPGLLKRRATTQANIEGICLDIIDFIDSIGTKPMDQIAYPSPAESCSWCSWKDPCLIASEDGKAADEMLVSIYGADRHARYEET